MRTKHWKIGLLGLALIPLLGTTCVKEKTIEFLINEESEAQFHAIGSQNVDLGSDDVDLKADIDLQQIAADNGVNPADIRGATFRGLSYRIDVPDAVAGRTITGALKVKFGARGEVTLGSISAVPADAMTGWIDITANVTTAGVAEINRFLADCLAEAQGLGTASDTVVHYEWDGQSDPTSEPTDFFWSVKITINIIPTTTGDFPDF